jgi:hypothetical protein
MAIIRTLEKGPGIEGECPKFRVGGLAVGPVEGEGNFAVVVAGAADVAINQPVVELRPVLHLLELILNEQCARPTNRLSIEQLS